MLRGWKESAGNRVYMQAFRASCMSLYEVIEIVPALASFAVDPVRRQCWFSPDSGVW